MVAISTNIDDKSMHELFLWYAFAYGWYSEVGSTNVD